MHGNLRSCVDLFRCRAAVPPSSAISPAHARLYRPVKTPQFQSKLELCTKSLPPAPTLGRPADRTRRTGTLIAIATRALTVVQLLPSILSADFARLADGVAAAERGGGSVIHVDIMDGHFVPNITLGPPVVKSLRKATDLPLDCHLMIENPDAFIPALAEAGANWIGVHYEACTHLHRTIEYICDHGMEPGVVINPATRVDFLYDILPMLHHVLVMSVNPGFGGQKFIPFSLEKIRHLVRLREERDLHFQIEVDGGVAHNTVTSVVEAGAELLVAGSAVFDGGDPERKARELLAVARAAERKLRETESPQTTASLQ